MEEYIQEALNQGFIQPSSSRWPWVSSSWVRRTGACGPLTTILWTSRLWNSCIHFPWPRLDLRTTHNLVHFREGDVWKTAFITPTGHYEYLVMPMALPTPPPSSRNSWTRCSGSSFTPSSLSTSMIYSSTPGTWPTIATTLRRSFRGSVLTICTSSWRSVNSIALLCSSLATSSVKWDFKWTRGRRPLSRSGRFPQSIKEIQSFLGFANFYRCFKDLSLHTAPLTSILRGNPKSLFWNTNAFEELKTAFSTVPILRHPDLHVPFMVEVDASTPRVGACCLSYPVNLHASSLALITLGNWPQHSKIVTLGIESCSPSSWLRKCGWRELTTHSLSSQIKNASTKQRDLIPTKSTGLCFSPGSTSPSPIAL